ncbi:MAG TPA: type II secretion system F family protein [Gaiellaceae bacterium]|jgi:type IV pilus assembly protein PilC|nr:type II secretion system F family protein [Gaiellaceae bacterium]
MAAYAYSAINAQGLELRGEIHAPDSDAAREQLRMRGLLAQYLDELPAEGEEGARTVFKKIKPKSLQIFSRQFATMIDAGLSVVGALVILEEQTEDKYLGTIVAALRADVEGGLLLSQAMARHPKIFSRLYVAMVEAGEAAGILDQVLDRVAFQIEKETQIKRRVKGAMIYPTMVLIFATLVLIGMLLFLVPIFVDIFKDLGGDLPTLTQYIVTMSDFLRADWMFIFPTLAVVFYAFRRGKRTEQGRRLWDRFKLKVPMKVGSVVLKVTMARFSRTLSTLVAAGVDIIKALEITGQTAGNSVIEDALADMRAKVQEGMPIAQPLVENPIFPPMVGHMVKIGEETGELEMMLSKIADFYEDEVDSAIQALTSIIEPIMMIGVGLMVGVIIIAMYLPMFKMLSLVK